MPGMADRFAQALQQAERDRDPAPLVALFAEGAALSNLAITEEGEGAADRFWRTYLDQFETVRSEFSHKVDGDGVLVLAWRSEGRLSDGRPIAYRGMSLAEHDGSRVTRFETTYDSAAFLREPAAT
ncbi:nuclear transport factor 2 family protein [Rubellimicrobium sp. CFH 75288]|uniref:nuclear transport factor 2 family protein n=1 Tax=Rubellimicrobium sp. CFH 75288 TaxID=2697034 RepID=UPI001412B803|nr:nuclear transport factor 2 family protein [Rubellimicrobium sp. CFH 75288]NAZ35611.1 nuclear transport factor 2 family protein [Rubellimicrobium sp. CFH 75288]